jgi:glutamate dehydrogenase
VLFAYFPARIVERCRDAIRVHRLRRELIATTLTNGIVDLMGTTFLTRTMRETGASATEVARAFVVVEALTDAHALAARAGECGPEGEVRFLDVLVAAVERAVRWLLATYPSIGPLEPMVERFQERIADAERALPAAELDARRARIAELSAAGVAPPLAEACARVEGLRAVLDVVHVAATQTAAARDVSAAYWGVGNVFDFTWLRRALDGVDGEDHWERRAVESLSAELDELRRDLTRQLLSGEGEVAARIATFRLRRASALERILSLLDDLRSARTITLAAIMVLVRELGRLEGAK